MGRSLNIETNSGVLTVIITKAAGPSAFYIFILLLFGIGHLLIAFFIIKSIRTEGAMAMRIAFVILGLVGLAVINKPFREILLFVKGKERISVDNTSILYKNEVAFIKKQTAYKLHEIQKLELVELGAHPTSQSSKKLLKIKYGTVVISMSNGSTITCGQTLDKEDIITLHKALELKINSSRITL